MGEQVALVCWLLREVGMSDVRVGATEWPSQVGKTKYRVEGAFYENFGRLDLEDIRCEPADRVLRECCSESATLVTDAALTNLGAALEHHGFRLGRWVAQGAFAGEGVVPSHVPKLNKFENKETCATYNFNGNVRAAEAALASPHISRKVFVSKNVCHRTGFNRRWKDAIGVALDAAVATGQEGRRVKALRLLHAAMTNYMKDGKVKKLHDPLALAVAIDESVCEFAEVHVFHTSPPDGKSPEWGSRLAQDSGQWIRVDYDEDRFLSTLVDFGAASQSC